MTLTTQEHSLILNLVRAYEAKCAHTYGQEHRQTRIASGANEKLTAMDRIEAAPMLSNDERALLMMRISILNECLAAYEGSGGT